MHAPELWHTPELERKNIYYNLSHAPELERKERKFYILTTIPLKIYSIFVFLQI